MEITTTVWEMALSEARFAVNLRLTDPKYKPPGPDGLWITYALFGDRSEAQYVVKGSKIFGVEDVPNAAACEEARQKLIESEKASVDIPIEGLSVWVIELLPPVREGER